MCICVILFVWFEDLRCAWFLAFVFFFFNQQALFASLWQVLETYLGACVWPVFMPTCPPVPGLPQTQPKGPEVCTPRVSGHSQLRRPSTPSFTGFDYKNGRVTFLKLIFQEGFLKTWPLAHFTERRKEGESWYKWAGAWLKLQTKGASWMEGRWPGEGSRGHRNGKLKNTWKGCLCIRMGGYMCLHVYACVCVCVRSAVCPRGGYTSEPQFQRS